MTQIRTEKRAARLALNTTLILLAGLTLSACNMMNRLANVGAEPQLSTIDSPAPLAASSEEHTSELQSLMRISYAVFCLKKKKQYHPVLLQLYTLSREYTHNSHYHYRINNQAFT